MSPTSGDNAERDANDHTVKQQPTEFIQLNCRALLERCLPLRFIKYCMLFYLPVRNRLIFPLFSMLYWSPKLLFWHRSNKFKIGAISPKVLALMRRIDEMHLEHPFAGAEY